MKNEENNKITVQDWLIYLNSQKQVFISSRTDTNTLLISFGTLFITSFLSLLQTYPYNVIGVIGLIYSLNGIYKGAKKKEEIGEGFRKIQKIQFYILEGNLREIEEIVEAYSSEFPRKL